MIVNSRKDYVAVSDAENGRIPGGGVETNVYRKTRIPLLNGLKPYHNLFSMGLVRR